MSAKEAWGKEQGARELVDLRTIARYRGVFVEPDLDGFTERDFNNAGMFDALLHAGEEPQSVIVRDYSPNVGDGCQR